MFSDITKVLLAVVILSAKALSEEANFESAVTFELQNLPKYPHKVLLRNIYQTLDEYYLIPIA